MGRSKKLKNLLPILKDKLSIIKSTLSINHRTTSAIHIAVLRATTRSALPPPPDHRISAVISLCRRTRHHAAACISAVTHRLHHHHGQNVYVALKSLLTLHNIITRGSFVPPDNLNFLDLSRFIDKTNSESRELSTWAQWYAGFLASNLSTSRVLGYFLSSKFKMEKIKKNIKFSLNMDLFKDIETLVSTIEEICNAPKSLHCQCNDLVYELMKLVGEDYRMTQYHTMIRLTELRGRIESYSVGELDELTRCFVRLESCKERLTELFVNRKRNDAFWDLEREIMDEVLRVKMESVSQKMVVHATESTQLKKQLVEASQRLRLLPRGEVNNWLSVDRVKAAA